MQKILISLIIIEFSFQKKIISLSLSESYGTYDIYLKLNEKNDNQQMELDMACDFLWVDYPKYYFEDEPLGDTRNFSIGNQTYPFQESISDLSFQKGTIKLLQFPLFQFKGKSISNFDTFPLSHSYRNESLSVIHRFIKDGLIETKAFGFYYNLTNQSANLYLGGLPDELISNYPYLKSCPVAKNSSTYNPYWGCDFTEVVMGDIRYKNSHFSYFQSNVEYIYAPVEFQMFLVDSYFKPFIQNKTCIFHSESSSMFFDCDCNQIKEQPPIIFKFKGFEVSFSIEEMSLKHGNFCYFNIEKNIEDENSWKFGILFLQKFVSLFDLETDTITFYSLTSLEPHNKKIIEFIYIFTSVAMFISILNYIIVITKNKISLW